MVRNILDPTAYDEPTYKVGRKYRNVKPRIIIDEQARTITLNLDQEIQTLRLKTPVDNTSNRHWCFWTESTAKTTMDLFSAGVSGTGPIMRHKNPKIEKICNNFNKKVNTYGQSIVNVIRHGYSDNAIYPSNSVWRILETKEEPYIDLGRLNMGNVVTVSHPYMGWTKYIYEDMFDESIRNKKNWFFSNKYSPSYDLSTNTVDYVGTIYKWHIPKDSTFTLNLVEKPIMSSVLQYIIFKRWIMWFMRKLAEKSWMPPLIGMLGNENVEFDFSPETERVYMNDFAKRMSTLSTFGIAILKYGESIEPLESKVVGRQSENLTNQIRLLDEQIVFGMGGSLGFQGVQQSQVTGDRQKEHSLTRAIKTHRQMITNELCNLHIKHLLPHYGYEIELETLGVEWPYANDDTNLEIIQMVTSLYEQKLITPEIAVKILQTVWSWLDPNDKEHIKWVKEQLKKEQESAKSTPFGAKPATDKLKKQNQVTRPTKQKKGAEQKRLG